MKSPAVNRLLPIFSIIFTEPSATLNQLSNDKSLVLKRAKYERYSLPILVNIPPTYSFPLSVNSLLIIPTELLLSISFILVKLGFHSLAKAEVTSITAIPSHGLPPILENDPPKNSLLPSSAAVETVPLALGYQGKTEKEFKLIAAVLFLSAEPI